MQQYEQGETFLLWASGLWHLAAWLVDTNVVEKLAASLIKTEQTFMAWIHRQDSPLNFGTIVQGHTASYSTRENYCCYCWLQIPEDVQIKILQLF
jgi:hypothetical protein